MFPQLTRGVYAAAVTPIHPNTFQPDLESVPRLLQFLAQRGCNGVLLLGTTGEGPSFSPAQRTQILKTAAAQRSHYPNLTLLAGTGTPSLDETIHLTRTAFELGFEGVVTLPPYYFRSVNDEGLFRWFSAVLDAAVPTGGALLGYHIPAVSGVPLSPTLLARLKDAYPTRFAGIKDSSASREHAAELGARFADDLLVFNGNDALFSHALNHHAAGCITALANLASPLLQQIWQGFLTGMPATAAQHSLNALRQWLDAHPPAAASLKAALHLRYAFPHWHSLPPLSRLTPPQADSLYRQFCQQTAYETL